MINPVKISSREKQVLELSASGFETKEIAKTLNISENTVLFHFKKIKKKLNSTNRTHAVALAICHNHLTIQDIK
ncbi:response regulator transcription factor [Pseudoalteromonas luteoviolacea]|uniref:response regulator transcription factor n=1 Tax=Pseudoalteromonas luteoviolacea TaxID=43657 RepID=UPI0011513ADE|nr:helix-turn-helix transcriptional regulator [Pseudoalteromonas luteoviolacea]